MSRGSSEELFPVVDTEIGKLGCAICYDWLFPETIRQLAFNGAEILIRVSAYMDPWGATPPMDWWTLFNRARAAENTALVVACNQGAQMEHYPPFSWPGGSMIVDHDGRDPRPGRPRARREGHRRADRLPARAQRARSTHRARHARAHADRGAPVYAQPIMPPHASDTDIDDESIRRRIETARRQHHGHPPSPGTNQNHAHASPVLFDHDARCLSPARKSRRRAINVREHARRQCARLSTKNSSARTTSASVSWATSITTARCATSPSCTRRTRATTR